MASPPRTISLNLRLPRLSPGCNKLLEIDEFELMMGVAVLDFRRRIDRDVGRRPAHESLEPAAKQRARGQRPHRNELPPEIGKRNVGRSSGCDLRPS